ncbi:formyltransferase family protein [Sulfurimonas sp.]|uniref:formyltransferase family protein n=1 Tax=Sulfurimonas sp. TaxID=2022749 RepID=UPI0019EC1A50|nr:formyltransferase family protein [Sulfurimonas sp.]MBE0515249.1 hypothetical protein [Sulfurimonas sp.]
MKFVFVGNRKFVLQEMCALKLDIIDALVIKNTHLEKEISDIVDKYSIISNKKELLNKLDNLEYDVLVSNGCPYILPISDMKKKLYINIHPSLLPNLKGIDPVIGAILYNKDSGATCHLMNDEIDAGDIISQVKIPKSEDLDVSLLYQLSFIAEKQVFRLAFDKNFVANQKQIDGVDDIYYSRCEEDKQIDFNESLGLMINKVKAFNNKSQGAYFTYQGDTYKVYDIDIVNNKFVDQYARSFKDQEVLFVYEDCVVVKKDNNIVKLSRIIGDLSKIKTKSSII